MRVLLKAPASTILKRLLPCALVFSSVILAQGAIDTYAGNDALFAGAGQPAAAGQIVGPNKVLFK